MAARELRVVQPLLDGDYREVVEIKMEVLSPNYVLPPNFLRALLTFQPEFQGAPRSREWTVLAGGLTLDMLEAVFVQLVEGVEPRPQLPLNPTVEEYIHACQTIVGPYVDSASERYVGDEVLENLKAHPRSPREVMRILRLAQGGETSEELRELLAPHSKGMKVFFGVVGGVVVLAGIYVTSYLIWLLTADG